MTDLLSRRISFTHDDWISIYAFGFLAILAPAAIALFTRVPGA